LFESFFNIISFLGLIPFLILIRKKKLFHFNNAAIPFIWLTAISSLYEYIFSYILKVNTSYWFQFYSLAVYISVSYMYFKILQPKYLNIHILSIICFSIIYSISFIYWSPRNALIASGINHLYLTCLIILLTVLWVKDLFEDIINTRLFNKNILVNLWESDTFYLIAGLFIYNCTTLFLFLSSNMIYDSELYFYDYWLVNILATLVLRLSLIISVWKMSKA
jgi:hypothetical protein